MKINNLKVHENEKSIKVSVVVDSKEIGKKSFGFQLKKNMQKESVKISMMHF